VRLDSIEEWEYVNRTMMDHPMHIHTNSFQLVGPDGESERGMARHRDCEGPLASHGRTGF